MADPVKIHGIEETLRNMREISPLLQKNVIRSTVTALAAEVRDDARGRAPVETGNLRRNIVSRGSSRSNISRGLVIVREEVGDRVMSRADWRKERFKKSREALKNAFYWRWVEYGTQHQPPRPFLRSAYYALKGSVEARFARMVKSKFDAALRKLEAKSKKAA